MKRSFAAGLAGALLLVMAAAQADNQGTPFAWPGGARAAVSLAYDDALNSQLDHAIPALNKLGLKASFYLQLSSPTVSARMADWRAAAQRGHELGNHTLFHQCSGVGPGRGWVQPHRDLAKTSAQQMKDQILLGNVLLHAIDGRRERTFTAPCTDPLAAGVPYLPLVKSEFVAIKSSVASAVPVSMRSVDPYAVQVFAPVDLSGKQLIDMVKAAGARGTMVNFTFHGIGGDHLSVSREAHQELLTFLAENRKVYWTDTFLSIMKHVKSQQSR